MAKKSLFLTYLFWLFGGLFGLHHFYLNRDYHALVWLMTLGGYFGMGWIRDLWRIPEYVLDANEDQTYMANLATKMLKEEKPPSGYIRHFGTLFLADTLGMSVYLAIPRDFDDDTVRMISSLLVPFASSLGIYLVGNIGRHEGSLKAALIAAYLTTPLYFFMESPPIYLSSLVASYVFNSKCKQWRRTPRPKKTFFKRVMFFVLCGAIYLSLWSSWFVFNCKVQGEGEEEIKCTEAAKHFFTSPIWKDVAVVLKQLWEIFLTHGWREVWKDIIVAFDPTGETHALSVLGLSSDSTQQEITARYRKLSLEWHPDRHKDPEAKQQAQAKFIEIKEAYEILSQIKSKRLEKNILSPNENVYHSTFT